VSDFVHQVAQSQALAGSASTEAVVVVDLDLCAETYARDYSEQLRATAPELGIDAGAMAGWVQDCSAHAKRGTFYFSIHWVYLLTQK
jgi:hypothetical protein